MVSGIENLAEFTNPAKAGEADAPSPSALIALLTLVFPWA